MCVVVVVVVVRVVHVTLPKYRINKNKKVLERFGYSFELRVMGEINRLVGNMMRKDISGK